MAGESIADDGPGITVPTNAILANVNGKTIPYISGPSLAHITARKTLNQKSSFASSKDLWALTVIIFLTYCVPEEV